MRVAWAWSQLRHTLLPLPNKPYCGLCQMVRIPYNGSWGPRLERCQWRGGGREIKHYATRPVNPSRALANLCMAWSMLKKHIVPKSPANWSKMKDILICTPHGSTRNPLWQGLCRCIRKLSVRWELTSWVTSCTQMDGYVPRKSASSRNALQPATTHTLNWY